MVSSLRKVTRLCIVSLCQYAYANMMHWRPETGLNLVLIQNRVSKIPSSGPVETISRFNVEAVSEQIQQQRMSDLTYLNNLKASLESKLSTQRAQTAELESALDAMHNETIRLGHRELKLRSKADEQMQKNELARKELLKLQEHITSMQSYLAGALQNAGDITGAPEVEILAELKLSDKHAAKRRQNNSVQDSLIKQITKTGVALALLEIGTKNGNGWWPWIRSASKGEEGSAAKQRDAFNALEGLSSALEQLSRSRESAESSLRAAFELDYNGTERRRQDVIFKLAEQQGVLEDAQRRVQKLTVALQELEKIGDSLEYRRRQIIAFASAMNQGNSTSEFFNPHHKSSGESMHTSAQVQNVKERSPRGFIGTNASTNHTVLDSIKKTHESSTAKDASQVTKELLSRLHRDAKHARDLFQIANRGSTGTNASTNQSVLGNIKTAHAKTGRQVSKQFLSKLSRAHHGSNGSAVSRRQFHFKLHHAHDGSNDSAAVLGGGGKH